MDSLLQGVEVCGTIDHDNNLSIDNRAIGELFQGGFQLREVPEERPLVPAIQPDFGPGPGERAETIPLGLVDEVPLRPLLGDFGLHSFDRRLKGKTHGRRVYAR